MPFMESRILFYVSKLVTDQINEKSRQLYEARLKEQRDNYAREQGAVKQNSLSIARGIVIPITITEYIIAVYALLMLCSSLSSSEVIAVVI